MKTKTRGRPLITAGVVPAATVTTALLAPPALAGSGDLDPSFGDVGRLGPILNGPAWSVEPQSDGTILFGGGSPGFSYWGSWVGTTGFVSRASSGGTVDPSFGTPELGDVQLLDATREPDGKVVATGRRAHTSEIYGQLAVLRLLPDGSLDTAFGDGGMYLLPEADYGPSTVGSSVLLDADGRIVVAGSRDENLLVLRLLTDGTPDLSFAVEGVFDGPATADHAGGNPMARTSLLRTDAGGYRVTVSATTGCQIVALTADGSIDTVFGSTGSVTVAPGGDDASTCSDLDALPDGRLLVSGSAGDRGFAARLLATGQPDPSFAAGAVAASMLSATAIAADGDLASVVAGVSDSGPIIMRLAADGGLDESFGDAGITTFDLDAQVPLSFVVNDLRVGTGREVVAVGGSCEPTWCFWEQRAFLLRLLGTDASSPGVLGFGERFDVETAEGEGEVVVNVRRTGGRSGSVTLDWATAAVDWPSATAGLDYRNVAGTLVWADGNAEPQQIRVPILTDNIVEEHEWFQVVLNGNRDGAGLGIRRATILIAADGAPHGQVGFDSEEVGGAEGYSAKVTVFRDYYSSGAVSVTVTPASGSAIAGQDFDAAPVTISWADGETGWKDAMIPIIDDDRDETLESFKLTLSSPTGGVVIGPRSTATVFIGSNDRPAVSNRSGGGALEFLSVLALGLARFLRRGRTPGTMRRATYRWLRLLRCCRRPTE